MYKTVRFATNPMSAQARTAPYTRAVVAAMRRLYPEALADKSFDNTGLLLEAPFDPVRRQMNSVLLTVDLTKAVADEAIERKDSIVIAYHPIIFRGLKSLTFNDTQQTTLLRLAAEGISVYSPHTAIDCARGGLGDWLADIVTGTPTDPPEQNTSAPPTSTAPAASKEDLEPENPFNGAELAPPARPSYQLKHHPSQLTLDDTALALGGSAHKRYPITASTLQGHPGAGMGRIVRFDKPVPLTEIIDRIGLGLGNPKGFPIAVPQGKDASQMNIGSIGICAGSGGSLFSQMEKDGEDVDLYFTGELSHHEALAAIEKGKCVICLFHSNTERGFLHGVLKGQLEATIGEEWERVRQEEAQAGQLSEEFRESLDDEQFDVAVSEVDRDPYGIMIAKSEVEEK